LCRILCGWAGVPLADGEAGCRGTSRRSPVTGGCRRYKIQAETRASGPSCWFIGACSTVGIRCTLVDRSRLAPFDGVSSVSFARICVMWRARDAGDKRRNWLAEACPGPSTAEDPPHPRPPPSQYVFEPKAEALADNWKCLTNFSISPKTENSAEAYRQPSAAGVSGTPPASSLAAREGAPPLRGRFSTARRADTHRCPTAGGQLPTTDP
jgi:hypothetical protein